MAKYFGKIGYSESSEIRPGVFKTRITEKEHYGDVLRDIRRNDNSGKVVDNLNITNSISIVATPYAMQNFHTMKYIEYMGAKWKITSVEVLYPRLNLTIGGVYNDSDGEEA